MTFVKTLSAAALLVVTVHAHAGGPPPHAGLLGQFLPRWNNVDPGMSPDSYQRLSRENQQDLGRAARRLLRSTFSNLGIPEQGAALTGAALGLATKGLKFNLNEEKTLGLQFDRMTSEKRGIYLNFKLDW